MSWPHLSPVPQQAAGYPCHPPSCPFIFVTLWPQLVPHTHLLTCLVGLILGRSHAGNHSCVSSWVPHSHVMSRAQHFTALLPSLLPWCFLSLVEAGQVIEMSYLRPRMQWSLILSTWTSHEPCIAVIAERSFSGQGWKKPRSMSININIWNHIDNMTI